MTRQDGLVMRDAWTADTKVITWADGTRESTKDGHTCTECHKQDCKFPVEHNEHYRVLSSPIAKSWDAQNPVI